MIRTKLLLLLLVVSIPSISKPRNVAQMKQMARQVLLLAHASDSIMLLDEAPAYGIYGTDKGFAVISKDDNTTAVLGYSETTYRKGNMPCGLQWWLSTVNATLMQGDEQQHLSSQRASAETFQPEVVGQLLTTKWGQNSPYNYKCPQVGSSKAPTGCVATAMAQILNYYRYPDGASGEGYYTTGSNKNKRYDVAINSTYQWDLLRDSYSSFGSLLLKESEKEAIGQLMFDAGAASHMNYNTGGSATSGYIAGNGFARVFQFDSLAIQCVTRDYCEDDNIWMNTILSELKAGRPVLMCASDESAGGHAFVLDGMDADGRVHVNWGWNGDADGYYSLNELNPKGILGTSSTYHYNSKQSIITNLRRDPTPLPGTTYHSCWVITEEYNLVGNVSNGLTISTSNDAAVMQHHHLVFCGKLGLLFLDANGQEVLFHILLDTSDSAHGRYPVEGGRGYKVSAFRNIASSDLAALPEGTYRVWLVSKADQEETPQHICYPGGKHKEYLVTKTADQLFTITMAEPTSIKQLSVPVDATLRYYNLQGHEVSSNTRGLLIVRQGDTVRKVVR